MTILEELEILAKDCEECAEAAEAESNYGERRAWQSVADRIRHAASAIRAVAQSSTNAPTRASFIAQVQDIIEEAIMDAQGVTDAFWGSMTPKEAARDIAALVPPFAWSDGED